MSSDVPDPTDVEARSVENVRIENEMEQSYIDYAMSVIAGRALPDVRDGLKARPPAHPLCDARDGRLLREQPPQVLLDRWGDDG